MAVSINSMKSMDTVSATRSDEVEIPEGKVEQVCRQWLVHEDGGLAYRLQSDEIHDHLNQNKVKSRLVRSDLMQAQTMQQLEIIEKQVQHEHQQQVMDEQLAKEMQLKLIEEEQRQAAELQRLAEEDERLAQKLAEKERQKVLRRKLAKEQAQIEKIKRDRLRLTNDLELPLDSIEIVKDDLNELDLSEFCMKPPGQLEGDQLHQFQADQDEELARFLQLHENQRKGATGQTKQTILEHQDYEIARLLYEEEKAKVRRAKEKRAHKQMLKQQQQIHGDSANASASGFDPSTGEQIYANLSQISYSQSESYYEEPITESTSPFYYGQSTGIDPIGNSSQNDVSPVELENSYQLPTGQSSSPDVVLLEEYEAVHRRSNDSSPSNAIANERLHRAYATYETNESVADFVNRVPPVLPVAFHNIAMDIDPTYNRRQKQTIQQPGDESITQLDELPIESSYFEYKEPASTLPVVDERCAHTNDSLSEQGGIHFAELARVSPVMIGSNTEMISSNPDSRCPQMVMPRHVAANVDEYIQFAMQQRQNAMLASGYPMPIHGQRRHVSPGGSHKKGKSKERSKEMCRNQ